MTNQRWIAIVIITAFSACRQGLTSKQFADLKEGFSISSRFIDMQEDDICHDLQLKSEDIHTRVEAELWLPIALRIRTLTNETSDQLDSMGSSLTQDRDSTLKGKSDCSST
jgi:hypothetical protein